MSTEENKANVRRAVEASNQKNLAAFDALCASEIIFHHPSRTLQGLQAYKQYLSMLFTAFPDAHTTIDDLIAEGDRVVVRQTFHGTHQGELIGIPPTGKQVSVTGIDIFRIANGKAVEQWANYDDLGLLQQLGVVPSMG